MLALALVEHDYLKLRGLGHESVGGRVELQRGFHLKLVSYFDRAFLCRLRSRINVLSTAQPKHHEGDAILCVLQEQLSNRELELELVELEVRVRWQCTGAPA